MTKKITFTILFFIFSFILINNNTYSQIVNVANLLKTNASEGFDFTISESFEYKKGNVDLISIGGGGAIRYKHKQHLMALIAEGKYAENNEKKYIRKIFEHLRYRYQFLDLLSMEFFAQHEYNEFKRLDMRGLVGIGPRLSIINNDTFDIAIASTYMREYNRYSKNPAFQDSEDRYFYHRWSNYLVFLFEKKEKFSFSTTAYYQPVFDEFSNYRILNENALTFKFNKFFSFVTKFIYSYSSVVPESIEKEDIIVLNTLELKFSID